MKRVLGLIIALMLALPATAGASEGNIDVIEGGDGVKVDIGKVGTIELGEKFFYLDQEAVKEFSKLNGNTLTGNEVAGIGPNTEDQSWFVYFDYENSGHIKNAEKEKIKSDKLLKQITEGTEAANEERPANNHIFVTGWDVEPFYDPATHNLTWSLMLEDSQKNPFVNYQMRLLTREGFLSIILVSDVNNRQAAADILSNEILSKFSPVPGEGYADFDESKDKVSEAGLTGLILGGAGLAAAKKLGFLLLLKKFWYVIAAVVVTGINWLRMKLKRRKDQPEEPSSTPPQSPNESGPPVI
ncbi:DUF2167 domain-containing protein [Paenibacillus dakarensis]|uniref:DUF2167 domain-containing protein n=1 Tax=Paenibacillus dakarensis TaxID=1527293 RepID=UPI0006D580BF|nr:DUF2167 domain-containing protein [Paenibacillus dakarensis]